LPENPFPEIRYKDPETDEYVDEFVKSRNFYLPEVSYPEGYDLYSIEGATRGITGDVMIYYKPADTLHWFSTGWVPVNAEKDFTVQIKLDDLQAGTLYELKIISRYPESKAIGESITGRFNTAPAPEDSPEILFTVSTGQAYADQDAPEGGFKIYNQMLRLRPDFFVHIGDIVYYDQYAKNIDLARWHWSRTYSLPTNKRFHRFASSYFIKDDHDTWLNDCWPSMETSFMGDFTFKQGQQVFLEQVPMDDKTYRTYRWGRDLQIWLMEGRDFRSPNDMPDGDQKTIWGMEQKEWLKNTVSSSDATFKILISPTPIVGPDRPDKFDNHSNVNFSHEGNEIRSFLQEVDDMYVVCGDRHWQYISMDEKTGVREYSCGPASDAHAGGWTNDMIMPEHRYLNVIGGFLAGKVTTIEEKPSLIFYHYNVDGHLLNTDTLTSEYPSKTKKNSR
jgi:alkaline phosphatase D